MFVDLTTWKQGSEWWFLFSLKYRAKLLVEGEWESGRKEKAEARKSEIAVA